jgi:uncharacterized protein (TIGR03084 family)
MDDLASLLTDLDAEGADLDALVRSVPPADRARLATPAAGWTVAHQVAHLAWTDAQALLAVTHPAAATTEFARVTTRPDPYGLVDEAAAAGAAQDPEALLDAWRTGRRRLRDALAAAPAGVRIPWFGPPMSAASMATARLMETWAHGQDVADALGVRRVPTRRLRHVAHIGVRARDFAYRVHGRTPPAEPFRVELAAPDGDTWTWGPDDASERVHGPAIDFCLLVTRRRHRLDLAITAAGPEAAAWLEIAQAFAGPPGADRAASTVP